MCAAADNGSCVNAARGKTRKDTVQSGDTLSKIAKKFGIRDWRELWQANRQGYPQPQPHQGGYEIDCTWAKVAATTVSSPTMDYLFSLGDSFTQIAKVYGISTRDLLRLNPELFKLGTVIKVPKWEVGTSIALTRLPINQGPLG